MDKFLLRKIAKNNLIQIAKNKESKVLAEEIIFNKLIKKADFVNAKTIAIYLSLPNEFNTKNLINYMISQKKRVCVPKINENEIVFYEIDELTQFRQNKFKIFEPINSFVINKNEIDLIVTPGLMFHKSGYRLGYGGGFYDKYLKDYLGNTIALTFKKNLTKTLWQVDTFDIKIKKIIND